MTDTISHLFVYGTLRQDVQHPLARLLGARATHRGRAEAAGRLVDLGPYPGVVEGEGVVVGDLYRLDREGRIDLLARLDAYEGCPRPGEGPGLFVRTTSTAGMEVGDRVPCWIYHYARPVAPGRDVPSGDWLAR